MSTIDEWIRKLGNMCTAERYAAVEWNGWTDTCYSGHEFWKHYPRGKQPDANGQILDEISGTGKSTETDEYWNWGKRSDLCHFSKPAQSIRIF